VEVGIWAGMDNDGEKNNRFWTETSPNT